VSCTNLRFFLCSPNYLLSRRRFCFSPPFPTPKWTAATIFLCDRPSLHLFFCCRPVQLRSFYYSGPFWWFFSPLARCPFVADPSSSFLVCDRSRFRRPFFSLKRPSSKYPARPESRPIFSSCPRSVLAARHQDGGLEVEEFPSTFFLFVADFSW